MREHVDLIVRGDVVMPMDAARAHIGNGAVAVAGDRIIAVGTAADLDSRFDANTTIGGAGNIVIPGLINTHQHLTGDRLLRSTIPDNLPPGLALTEWAIPAHAAHTPDDDELSATLALIDAATNGITYTVEAGTVANPARVLNAFDAVGVGGTLGSWGWDVAGEPYAGSVEEVIRRQLETLSITAGHKRVNGWVTLVGHDLMSDELVIAASDLAKQHNTGLTFHLSPSDSDPTSYLDRTGRRPFQHLADLGVLGDHILVAHAVHIDDDELDLIIEHDVAVASCPWAYLRLGQGITRSFMHSQLIDRGGRVSLGCDSENAGDAVDILLAARLFAGLTKDSSSDPTLLGSVDALALATIDGARAIGMGDEIGSLEVGKRADIVVVDTTGAGWTPIPEDPTTGLIWASGGRDVRDVVASGRLVVSNGECVTVDHRSLAARAQKAHERLLSRCGENSCNE